MMNPDLKQKWLEALRSGEYTQQSGALEKVDPASGEIQGNCCLGVLCRVAGLTPTRQGDDSYYNVFEGCIATFTTKKCNEFGLTIDHHRELITMNDRDSKSFTEIADWIEENV